MLTDFSYDVDGVVRNLDNYCCPNSKCNNPSWLNKDNANGMKMVLFYFLDFQETLETKVSKVGWFE